MSTLDLRRPVVPAEPGPGDAAGESTAQTQLWSISIEQLVYLGLGLLALLTHLWGLGDRALHHDETLHAAYSWYLYVGRGYIHDPLLHGPLLYHIGALIYWIFGDSDFTSRLGPALTGTALTLTPYLIRREIGRPAALFAAIYLLISPVFLYYGRFIRHDIYSLLCEMLVFVAIVRYASTRRSHWLYTGAVAFALMWVNQETTYLFVLIMAAPLVGIFLWRVYRPGVLILAALAVLVASLVFVLPGKAEVDGANNAIRDQATGEMKYTPGALFGWRPLETADNSYALRVRNRADNNGGQSLLTNLGDYLSDLGQFFGHPAILLALGLGVGALAVLGWLIWFRAGASGERPWQAARSRGDPAVDTFASLAVDWRWLYALLIVAVIYTLFFTAFFTNLIGLISGTAGSLLYWLAQHDVQRGSQPAHYYLIQLIIYEPLLLIWSLIGFGFLIYDVVHHVRDKARKWSLPVALSTGLLAWWVVAAFVIYSWAGEKMPWLTVHVALPMALFAAWALQRALAPLWAAPGDEYNLEDRRPATAVFAGLFVVIVSLGFVLMTAIVGFGTKSVLPPWVAPVFTLALLTLLTVGAGLRWNWGWSLAMLALCVSVAGSVYTVRNAFRLVYQNGDIPREMLVYTQTSPDVARVIRRLEEASIRRGHGLSMPVIYDNETVWTWYMRDFTNAQRIDGSLDGPPDPSVQAVLLLDENLARFPENRQYLNGFVLQRYPLRWWFPEDQVYRLAPDWREAPIENVSLLGQVLRAPFDRDVDIRLWNFLIFRDPGFALGSSDVIVAVRPELAGQIGIGLGGSVTGTDAP